MLSTAKYAIVGSIAATTGILYVTKTDPRKTQPFLYLVDAATHGLLHKMDAERAHDLVTQLMRFGIHPVFDQDYPILHTKVLDLEFRSPVGKEDSQMHYCCFEVQVFSSFLLFVERKLHVDQ